MPNRGLKLDRWGYSVNTTSDDCIQLINAYYMQVLTYGKDQAVILKAVKADKGCALAHVLSAAYAISQGSANAALHLANARKCLMEATTYEKTVLMAVASLLEVQREAALTSHSELLAQFPRDLVSLKRAQVLCFYMGRPDESLKLALLVLPANEEVAYMYGMLAFPLLEMCRMNDAEEAARNGLVIEKKDPWAQHALCHVLQHKCYFKEAIAFMEENSESWNTCCSFMYSHNWWHLALSYLEWGCGHALEKVLAIYDNHIWSARCRDTGGSVQVSLNALGLLLRLELRGHVQCVDARISEVTDHLYGASLWHKEWLLDLLTVWALAYVGESNKADLLLRQMKSRVEISELKEQEPLWISLKLGAGLYEYGRGNHKEAFNVLGPTFDIHKYKAIGASDEQLDVFEEMWCTVSLHSGHVHEVSEILMRRTSDMCGSPFNWKLMEEFYIKSGNPEKALSAAKQAESVKASYLRWVSATYDSDFLSCKKII